MLSQQTAFSFPNMENWCMPKQNGLASMWIDCEAAKVVNFMSTEMSYCQNLYLSRQCTLCGLLIVKKSSANSTIAYARGGDSLILFIKNINTNLSHIMHLDRPTHLGLFACPYEPSKGEWKHWAAQWQRETLWGLLNRIDRMYGKKTVDRKHAKFTKSPGTTGIACTVLAIMRSTCSIFKHINLKGCSSIEAITLQNMTCTVPQDIPLEGIFR